MRVLYTILLVGAAIFYLLYQDSLSFLTLLTMLIFPAILIVLLIITVIGISAEFQNENTVSEKGKPTCINVRIRSRSFFPASNVRMYIQYSNRFDGIKHRHIVNIPIAAKSTETVSFNIKYTHCGVVDIVIKKITVFDIIRLFRISKRIIKTSSAVILPDIIPVDADVISCADTNTDSDTFYTDRSGDDASEVFDLREYHEGDNLNRIHWKLSSRSDDMIVKEFSKPYTSSILVLPEISACKTENQADALLSIMSSIAFFLTDQGMELSIGRIIESDSIAIEKVKNYDELLGLSCSLLQSMHKTDTVMLIDGILSSDYTVSVYSHIIYISPQCNVDSLTAVKNSGSAMVTYIQPVLNKNSANADSLLFSEIDEYIPVSMDNIIEGLINIIL